MYPPNTYWSFLIIVTVFDLPLHLLWNVFEDHPCMEARQHRYHLEWEPATGSKNRLRWLMRNSSLPRIDDDICSPRIWTHIGKSLMFVTSVLHKKMIQSNLEIRKTVSFPTGFSLGTRTLDDSKFPLTWIVFGFPLGHFVYIILSLITLTILSIHYRTRQTLL